MINDVSIVVLTPVKNEDWILDKFLSITSLFSDFIFLADQNSTDNTKKIIDKHKKAIYIHNDREEYDEEYRQRLLIQRAREFVKGKVLFLALDADEIINSQDISSQEWEIISRLEPGTQVYFKKPDVLPDLESILDYKEHFLIGFMDDGRSHNGLKFHSPRVPTSEKKYYSTQISFIHLALVRNLEYYARQRLYTVMENINGTEGLRLRYRKYSRTIQGITRTTLTKKANPGWNVYDNGKISLGLFETTENNNFNKQILEKFDEQGSRRFWMDDIWYVDYSDINRKFFGRSSANVIPPPTIVNLFRMFLISFYGAAIKVQLFFLKK